MEMEDMAAKLLFTKPPRSICAAVKSSIVVRKKTTSNHNKTRLQTLWVILEPSFAAIVTSPHD